MSDHDHRFFGDRNTSDEEQHTVGVWKAGTAAEGAEAKAGAKKALQQVEGNARSLQRFIATSSYSSFLGVQTKLEMLDHSRQFKEDEGESGSTEIEEIDVYVHKLRCLGMGKRLTWHLECIQNRHVNPQTILEHPEHISCPVKIKMRDQGLLGQVLGGTSPCIYTQSTSPTFYFSDYKVAIVADISNQIANFRVSQDTLTSQFQYFARVRESLQIIIRNLFFQIKNEVLLEIQRQNLAKKRQAAQAQGLGQPTGSPLVLGGTAQRASSKGSLLQGVGIKASQRGVRDSFRQIQSDDESMASDSLYSFWQRENNFPIDEQTESYLESMCESNQQGYESTKQPSPSKKQYSGRLKTQVSFGPVNKVHTKQKITQTPPQPSDSPGTTSLPARADQAPHPELNQTHQGGGGSGEQAHVKEFYEPRVFLSLVLKRRLKIEAPSAEASDAEKAKDEQSGYKTLFLDKLLKYGSLEELAKGIDMQLSRAEDEVIELIRAQEDCPIERHANAGLNMIEYGAAILDLMKEDIKPLLVVIGDLKDIHLPKMLQAKLPRSRMSSGRTMLESMTRLSYKDTKLIVVDLNDRTDADNVASSSHLSDLKFLCLVTQGRYFTFAELAELNQRCLQQAKSEQRSRSKSVLSQYRHQQDSQLPSGDEGDPSKDLNSCKSQDIKVATGAAAPEARATVKQPWRNLQPSSSDANTSSYHNNNAQQTVVQEVNLMRDYLRWRWNPFEIRPNSYEQQQKLKKKAASAVLAAAAPSAEQPAPTSGHPAQPEKSNDGSNLRGSSQKKHFIVPWLNELHKILFSRSVYQSADQPQELQTVNNYIDKKQLDPDAIEQYRVLKGLHPVQAFQIERYSVRDLYQEGKLMTKYHKIIVRTDTLERVNFSRICEFRSKCLFRLHSIKSTSKESRKEPGRRYGERIKYLFWFNSQVVLTCHVKRVIEGGAAFQPMPLQMDLVHYPHGGMDKAASENPESAKVEIVYKLVGDVQTVQNFIRDFLISRQSGAQGGALAAGGQSQQSTMQHHGKAENQAQADGGGSGGLGQPAPQPKKTSKGRGMLNTWINQRQGPPPGAELQKEVSKLIVHLVSSDKRFLLFSRLSDRIRKTFRFLNGRQHHTRLVKYKQKRTAVKLADPASQQQLPRNAKMTGQQQSENLKEESTKAVVAEAGADEGDWPAQAEAPQEPTQPRQMPTSGPHWQGLTQLDKQHHFAEEDPSVLDDQREREREQQLLRRRARRAKHTQLPATSHQNVEDSTNPFGREAASTVPFPSEQPHVEQQTDTQEQSRQLLQGLTAEWTALRELSQEFTTEEQWAKHFSYRRQDLIAGSNYTSLRQIYQLQQIYLKNYQLKNQQIGRAQGGPAVLGVTGTGKSSSAAATDESVQTQTHFYGAMRDSTIILKTFLAMREFTTFSLDGQSFVQVFKDKRNKIHNDIFGFCLIKLEWRAFNVLSVHQGFYQVSEKYKNQFAKELINVLVNINLSIDSSRGPGPEQRAEGRLNFECYQKNIVDRIFVDEAEWLRQDHGRGRKPELNITKFIEDLTSNKFDELSKRFHDHNTYSVEMLAYSSKEPAEGREPCEADMASQPKKRTLEMFQASWKFISDNFKTSKEVYVSKFQQRLDEGFIFVSSFNKMNFNASQFVKILPARKTKYFNHDDSRRPNPNGTQYPHVSSSKRKYSMNSIQSATPLGGKLAKRPFPRFNQMPLADHQAPKRGQRQEQASSIVIQYILRFDKTFERQHTDRYCLRTHLLMEKESCYFQFQKQSATAAGSVRSGSSPGKGEQSLRPRSCSVLSNVNSHHSHRSNQRSAWDDEGGEPRRERHDAVQSLGEIHFFNQLQEYVQEVDNYQQSAVCTFHNILKNSLLQSINQEVILQSDDPESKGSYEITHQLCYFKNINIINKRQMRRQNLERQIKERIRLMRKDQMHFLSLQYPELINDLRTRPLDLDILPNELAISQYNFAEKSVKAAESEQMINMDQLQVADEVFWENELGHVEEAAQANGGAEQGLGRRYEGKMLTELAKKEAAPENNIFELDGLLENAISIGCEDLKVPNLQKISDEASGIKDQNFAKKFIDFFERLRQILIAFSDFKKLDLQPWSHDLFFKLVAKEIIFIIQVPSQASFEKQLLKKAQTTIKIEYFIIKKKQIKLTERLKEKTVFRHFLDTESQPAKQLKQRPGNLTQDYSRQHNQALASTLVQVTEPGDELPSARRDASETAMEGTDASGIAVEGPSHLKPASAEQPAEARSHYDEKINQIDQIEDYLIYQGFDQANKSIQFESQVKNIVDNFLLFIRQSYDKLFSETVLMNLNIGGGENDQSYLTQADFAQTLKSMSESRFIIDISFLGLLIRSIRGNRAKQDEADKAADRAFKNQMRNGVDRVFELIKTRNFKECAIDRRFYIFSHNEDDDKIDLRDSPRLNDFFNKKEQTPVAEAAQNEEKDPGADAASDKVTYSRNLQAGTDAFQENEMQDLLAHEQRQSRFKKATNIEAKKRDGQQCSSDKTIESNLQYDTCKKLIFNADLVVKDSAGDILIREPVRNVSQIFERSCEHQQAIDQVVNELQAKIRHILEQRGVLEIHTANEDGQGTRPTASSGDRGQGSQQENAKDKNGLKEDEVDEDDDFGLLRLFEPWTSAQHLQKKEKQLATSKDKGDAQTDDDDAFKNLSEQEKMNRYRKIYRILQQFVNDEAPSQAQSLEGHLDILNQDQSAGQNQPGESKMASSVEVHFCFNCVPEHIGLIQDKFIDLLCFKKDNILVNDDDYEDLIRVCNQFNLLGLTTTEILNSQKADLKFQMGLSHSLNQIHGRAPQPYMLVKNLLADPFLQMFDPFDNKQITQSIPFFFKHSYSKNDYRIFRYNEVQRKIIYGVLRRVYALLAEIILQNLLRYSDYNQISVAMMKKYLGQLLSSQRIEVSYPVLHNYPYKQSLIHQLLLDEVRSGYVFKLKQLDSQYGDSEDHSQSSSFRNQQVFFLAEKIALDDPKAGEKAIPPATLEQASERSDGIMFLKVTKSAGQVQQHKCSIELIYYSACFDRSLNSMRSLRQSLLKKLKQIEDRIKVKLILMQVDERKELSELLKIEQPQSIIVTHLANQSKIARDSVIVKQDLLDRPVTEEEASAAEQQLGPGSSLNPKSSTASLKTGTQASFAATPMGAPGNFGRTTAPDDPRGIKSSVSNQNELFVQRDNTLGRQASPAGGLGPRPAANMQTEQKQQQAQESASQSQPAVTKKTGSTSRYWKNMQRFGVGIKSDQAQQQDGQISSRAQRQIRGEHRKATSSSPVQREAHTLIKFYEYSFKLTKYLDLESAIEVITSCPCLYPYVLYHSQDQFHSQVQFIVSEQALVAEPAKQRDDKQGTLAQDSSNQQISKRYILRIPEVKPWAALSSTQSKRLDHQATNSSHQEQQRLFLECDQNRIPVEIFGIDQITDIDIFKRLFDEIDEFLRKKTIDKFSEKVLENQKAWPRESRPVAHQQQPPKHASTLVSKEPQTLQTPFQLDDEDIAYIRSSNQKFFVVFEMPEDLALDKFYFLQVLMKNLQHFLVPAQVVGQAAARQSESPCLEVEGEPKEPGWAAPGRRSAEATKRLSSFRERRPTALQPPELEKASSAERTKEQNPTSLELQKGPSASGLVHHENASPGNQHTPEPRRPEANQHPVVGSFNQLQNDQMAESGRIESPRVRLGTQSTLHFYNDKVLAHCLSNMQPRQAPQKTDAPQQSRRLLEQIMNEIRNSNVLMQVSFLRPAASAADHAQDAHRIESVLQMEEEKEFVLQEKSLYGLKGCDVGLQPSCNGGPMSLLSREICLVPQTYDFCEDNQSQGLRIIKNSTVLKVGQRPGGVGVHRRAADLPASGEITKSLNLHSDEEDIAVASDHLSSEGSSTLLDSLCIRVDYLGKLDIQMLKDYVTLFVNKTLSSYTMEVLIRQSSAAFEAFQLDEPGSNSHGNNQLGHPRERLGTLWNTYSSSLHRMQAHIRAQTPDQVFRSYRTPPFALYDSQRMLSKLIALLLSTFKSINDGETERGLESRNLFTGCSCILMVCFTNLATEQRVRKLFFKLPCLLEKRPHPKDSAGPRLFKKRLKKVLTKVQAEIEKDDLLFQNTKIEYQIVLITQSLQLDRVLEGLKESADGRITNVRFLNLDRSKSSGAASPLAERRQDSDCLKAFPSFEATATLDSKGAQSLDILREAVLVVSLLQPGDSTATPTSMLELLSYNLKRAYVERLVSCLPRLVDQEERANHDEHLDLLQRKVLTHCHADYEFDHRQQVQGRRKRRAGQDWWSALCGGQAVGQEQANESARRVDEETKQKHYRRVQERLKGRSNMVDGPGRANDEEEGDGPQAWRLHEVGIDEERQFEEVEQRIKVKSRVVVDGRPHMHKHQVLRRENLSRGNDQGANRLNGDDQALGSPKLRDTEGPGAAGQGDEAEHEDGVSNQEAVNDSCRVFRRTRVQRFGRKEESRSSVQPKNQMISEECVQVLRLSHRSEFLARLLQREKGPVLAALAEQSHAQLLPNILQSYAPRGQGGSESEDAPDGEVGELLDLHAGTLERRVFFINVGYVFKVGDPSLQLNSQQREEVAKKILRTLQLARIYTLCSMGPPDGHAGPGLDQQLTRKRLEPLRPKNQEHHFVRQFGPLFSSSKYLELVQCLLEEQRCDGSRRHSLEDHRQEQPQRAKTTKYALAESAMQAISQSRLIFSQSHQFMHHAGNQEDEDGIRAFCSDITSRLKLLGFQQGRSSLQSERPRGKGQSSGGQQAREDPSHYTGCFEAWQPEGRHFANDSSQRQQLRTEQWTTFEGRTRIFLNALKDNLQDKRDPTKSVRRAAMPDRRQSTARHQNQAPISSPSPLAKMGPRPRPGRAQLQLQAQQTSAKRSMQATASARRLGGPPGAGETTRMSECDNVGRAAKYSARAHSNSKNSLLNSPTTMYPPLGRPPRPTAKGLATTQVQRSNENEPEGDQAILQVEGQNKDKGDYLLRELRRSFFLKLVGLRQLAIYEVTKSLLRTGPGEPEVVSLTVKSYLVEGLNRKYVDPLFGLAYDFDRELLQDKLGTEREKPMSAQLKLEAEELSSQLTCAIDLEQQSYDYYIARLFRNAAEADPSKSAAKINAFLDRINGEYGPRSLAMNPRLHEGKDSNCSEAQWWRRSQQKNHVETLVLDVHFDEDIIIRAGLETKFHQIVREVLTNRANAYIAEKDDDLATEGVGQRQALYKYYPLDLHAQATAAISDISLPQGQSSDPTSLYEDPAKGPGRERWPPVKHPRQKQAKGPAKQPQIQELYDRLIHLRPNCTDEEVKEIAFTKKVFPEPHDLLGLEGLRGNLDAAFRVGGAGGLGAGVFAATTGDSTHLSGARVIKSFKTVVRLAYQYRELHHGPAAGSARQHRDGSVESQKRNLVTIINRDIQNVKQTMKQALAQSLLTFFKECLWDAFFEMATASAQPTRDGPVNRKGSRRRADSGGASLLSPKLSDGQIKKMLELSQVIDIKDIDPRKYGKFHCEGNFDSAAFAHLVARFRQGHGQASQDGLADASLSKANRANSSGNTLCFIMQDEPVSNEIMASGPRNTRRAPEEDAYEGTATAQMPGNSDSSQRLGAAARRQGATGDSSMSQTAGYDQMAMQRPGMMKIPIPEFNRISQNYSSSIYSPHMGVGMRASPQSGGLGGQANVPQASHQILIFKRERPDVIVDVKYHTQRQILQICLVRRHHGEQSQHLMQATTDYDGLQFDESGTSSMSQLPLRVENQQLVALSRRPPSQSIKIRAHERRLINEVTNYLIFYKCSLCESDAACSPSRKKQSGASRLQNL